MKAVTCGLGFLLAIGLLIETASNRSTGLKDFDEKYDPNSNTGNPNPTSSLPLTDPVKRQVPLSEVISNNERNQSEWWHQPAYSAMRYDPSQATDPSYRELVTRHIFLDSFYKSPLRLTAPFRQTVETIKGWGIDPKQHLNLVVHAHNIAWEYLILHRNFRISNGNLVTENERKTNKGRLNWNIESLKHRFQFLFDDYPEAQFKDLHTIQPEGMFIDPRLKIEPGTLLISD